MNTLPIEGFTQVFGNEEINIKDISLPAGALVPVYSITYIWDDTCVCARDLWNLVNSPADEDGYTAWLFAKIVQLREYLDYYWVHDECLLRK
jgi:hypothetical protein